MALRSTGEDFRFCRPGRRGVAFRNLGKIIMKNDLHNTRVEGEAQ
jgi:hypothetical protein